MVFNGEGIYLENFLSWWEPPALAGGSSALALREFAVLSMSSFLRFSAGFNASLKPALKFSPVIFREAKALLPP